MTCCPGLSLATTPQHDGAALRGFTAVRAIDVINVIDVANAIDAINAINVINTIDARYFPVQHAVLGLRVCHDLRTQVP